MAPLLVHWGGDHDRAAALLADLPFPLRVIDGGSDGAFQIVSDAAPGRLAEPFPPVTDTPAVKDRIRRVTAERRKDSEWSDAEVDWMNAVLRGGDRAAQGYVVRHLAGSERISEEAYETLLGDWARIYVKAPKDVLVWDMLRTMERRGDPRRDEVIETCTAPPPLDLLQAGWGTSSRSARTRRTSTACANSRSRPARTRASPETAPPCRAG